MTTSKNLIAILEDDTGMRRAVERLLSISGYRTCSFASTDELGVIESVTIAYCMVVDVELPGTSGPAFYEALAQPRPPVVFVTAHDSEKTRAAVTRVGASELLTKPFLGSDLLGAIERATRVAH
ncbi:Response regulator protein TmoT [Pandoraea pneumonica]|uniref:Response regulator protein TmoT n=1 Tax=Pandoraea pneumonica TaxID=2508299 RepID=A0A5E4SIX9_9BURK|nr:response regulator [Pandoraea pneumonica]VVD75245.1 Response regulator protein TmoT [Pandoraea pneumonica]